MGPIEDANVNIVKPKKTTFKEDQKEPSASVLLKLKPNTTVDPNQIRAIRDFICSAVEGLEPDKVKICDDHANDLSLGYHNHDQEFRITFEGVTAMEWMMARLTPKVAIEFDPGWAVLAGSDPLAFIATNPNLGPDAHLTPTGRGALAAPDDRADWRRIVPALAASGVEWAFVKPLAHPDSLDDLEASRRALSDLKL